jgi:tRNA nucleotidyltransferase/poly(A) polymerase
MTTRLKFKDYVFREEAGTLDQPHTIACNPPMKIPAGLQRLAEAFKKAKEVEIGKEVDSKAGGEKAITLKAKTLFIVGGAVRCFLLGQTPSDYDLVTDAHPEEAEKILHQAKPPIKVTSVDKKMGKITVNVDGETYEIHTMRKEPKTGKRNKDSDKESGGATFTVDTKEDSQGRDLTVNSLYYDINAKKIIDHVGGLRHLKDGVVKFNGKGSDRLGEDGTRKFRALRILNTMPHGKLDPDSEKDIQSNKDEEIAPEEIREEFLKAIKNLHTNVTKVLQSYDKVGLLDALFPGLELDRNFPDCKTCKTPPIVLASLLKKNKPSKLVKVLKELKYSEREIKDAVYLINLLVFHPDYIYDYKKEILNTSLTKRQILDWAKMNDLDKNVIEKLVDYKFSVNHQELIDQGLNGDELRNSVRDLEAKNFKKHLVS